MTRQSPCHKPRRFISVGAPLRENSQLAVSGLSAADSDGILRRVQTVWAVNDELAPNLSLAIARLAMAPNQGERRQSPQTTQTTSAYQQTKQRRPAQRV